MYLHNKKLQRKYEVWQNSMHSVECWPPPKCHCSLCCVCYCQPNNTVLLTRLSLSFCICMQQHYCTWALTYCTAEAPKAPVISTAHVFEEVEVFQLNVKLDLLGLTAGLRHFIADSVSELEAWKFSPLEAQSDRFVVGFFFFLMSHAESHLQKVPTGWKPFNWVSSLMFWVFISNWSLCSLISWGQPSTRAH